MLELREADVAHHIRFCVDRDVRCGQWYMVKSEVISLDCSLLSWGS